MMIGGMVLALIALGCGQVRRETHEIRINLRGTSVLSGGAEEGACGLPLVENTGIYMMEPSQKYEVTYRAWTDADGRRWLDGGSAGCTVEVESLDVLKAKDAQCIIAEGSTMDLWGFYERVYSYLEIDLDAGTFRASARSLVIDNTEEKRENCFVTEGRVEKL
jgi:hypothetical protein